MLLNSPVMSHIKELETINMIRENTIYSKLAAIKIQRWWRSHRRTQHNVYVDNRMPSFLLI